MMERFLERLRELRVPGVYLGVGARNTRAIAFYERMGFEKLLEEKTWSAYGMRL
ncbi:MAG: GNAT family N-acetyltransferase [Pleurocapsa sp. SU_196_0]|nr:GNAT family N-acetyltransferase [Pleurocapsa sp. SU_196_0]